MKPTARALALIGFLGAGAAASSAYADVEIETTPVRDYVLPGTFDLNGAQVQRGANDVTIISNTIGTAPDDAACGVLIASDTDARVVEYKFGGDPTQCVGVLPHPGGGVFLRTSNPVAVDGEVTGVTAYVDGTDQEAWAVTDETLVAAQPEPTGTGEFQGAYVSAHPVMAYSPELDKLLAFTVGKLSIGQDEKFLSQAHVINADSGQVRVSGQTFGLSGVGLVGGATTRTSDGNFLIYYYSSGDRGAFFYAYDGRTNIDFFKPRGEDWTDRFVQRMVYANDLLHLLWTPSDGTSTETRVTATTDSGAELWSATFDPSYTFANGQMVDLGQPSALWVGSEYSAVLHQSAEGLLLRVIDINGETPGVARLDDVSDFPPVAIVNGANGSLKVLTYDEPNRHVYELTMGFVDVPDYDPDAGIPDGGLPGDFEIPADVGLRDVLEAAGCCATIRQTPSGDGLFALLSVIGLLALRRRSR